MNDSGDDESSGDSLDGEVESLPQSLTRETIAWLTTGLPFQNFKNNLVRSAYPPLEYVNRILEAALPTLEACSAWFNIEWDLLDYVESELGDGQNLSTVLTLSGDGDNAYAASCLEYCVGIWPNTGEAVVRALETTIKENWYQETLPSGTKLLIELARHDISTVKKGAIVSIEGSRTEVIQIAQQLTWFCAVFRVPKDGRFTRSEFVLNSSKRSREFNVKLLKLKNVGPTDMCWHPLFTNGVLAYEFPIRSRCCDVGVELPFEAMLQLSGVIGPVQYRGGVVLKGYSKILFPQSTKSLSPVSSPESTQWHLVYQTGGDFIDLSSIAEYNDRVLCTLESLESLMHSRTFLGCYKEVNIHLGTETASYHQIDTSNAKDLKRRPKLSSFTFGLSLPKFGGPSASMTYTLPKGLSISRKEDSYEQVLSLGSYMPMILYDTSDRRAWMVPMSFIWSTSGPSYRKLNSHLSCFRNYLI